MAQFHARCPLRRIRFVRRAEGTGSTAGGTPAATFAPASQVRSPPFRPAVLGLDSSSLAWGEHPIAPARHSGLYFSCYERRQNLASGRAGGRVKMYARNLTPFNHLHTPFQKIISCVRPGHYGLKVYNMTQKCTRMSQN